MEGSVNWTGRRTERGKATLLGRLIRTDADWSATIARVVLGLVILPHGLQKTIGAPKVVENEVLATYRGLLNQLGENLLHADDLKALALEVLKDRR